MHISLCPSIVIQNNAIFVQYLSTVLETLNITKYKCLAYSVLVLVLMFNITDTRVWCNGVNGNVERFKYCIHVY